MRILAFDTSCSGCSAAIWEGGAVLSREVTPMERGHAEALAPMLLRVLESAGTSLAAIDRLAVTTGPGSFTGLRVGLATARGLALALNIPVVGCTTFEVFAEPWRGRLGDGEHLLVVVDSRRQEPFAQFFDHDLSACGPPRLLGAAAILETMEHGSARLAGNGIAAIRGLLPDSGFQGTMGEVSPEPPTIPDVVLLAALALRRTPCPGRDLKPMYLRAPDAKLPSSR